MNRLLGIYLNDHLAGATSGLELARRCRSENPDTDLGRYLDGFIDELTEDRLLLGTVMEKLGVAANPAKVLAGWTLEKVGRLKRNGRLVSYSPLSRLEELEGLVLGVEGKLSLWRTLKRLRGRNPSLAEIDLAPAIARGQRQRAALEKLRQAAAVEAFADGERPAGPGPSAQKQGV